MRSTGRLSAQLHGLLARRAQLGSTIDAAKGNPGALCMAQLGRLLHSSGQPGNAAQPAQALRADEAIKVVVDDYGSVSVLKATDLSREQPSSTYSNKDGQRVEDGRYKAFLTDLCSVVPNSRVYTDPLRMLAYGGDASFYRLLPKAVVKVHSEAEMQAILPLAEKHNVPVTFRAAGTSLSGQAITDSVLLKISHVGRHFRDYEIKGDGSQVSAEAGLLGGEVNKYLAAFARRTKQPMDYRIGPDPASIDSAMIGGIVANNASGMCCGVAQNTYHTMADMRLVLLDGTVLDTADAASCQAFLKSHAKLCGDVSALAERVQSDPELSAQICRKYSMKNTVGYSLNALVDFPPSDPISIIKHLMVGSEGTLGFVSRITYNTVPEWLHKASTFVLFPDLKSACDAVKAIKATGAVSAVELCDYNSLRLAQEEMVGLVTGLGQAQKGSAGLLIECRAPDVADLDSRTQKVLDAIASTGTSLGGDRNAPMPLGSYPFRKDRKETKIFWDFRKGLVPIVGGSRAVGTQMMIEDVVCPVEALADMTQQLIDLFEHHGYTGASAVGHALEGNLHLVFAQGFRSPEEVETFGKLLEDMAHIVLNHKGSLKGEHGTGRNMAPFVELEWGAKAHSVMREIKEAFDPANLLNPGVIINEDPNCHMHFLKPSPPSSAIVDHCMECGYCEAFCPSRDVTITPRQRIQVYREITRLRGLPTRTKAQEERLTKLVEDYAYHGDATCAVDGMCAERCPVDINTGALIKSLRVAQAECGDQNYEANCSNPKPTALSRGSTWVANHFGAVTRSVPLLLDSVNLARSVLGDSTIRVISEKLNQWTGRLVPVWNPYVPKGARKLVPPTHKVEDSPAGTPTAQHTRASVPKKVVYLPSCVTRMMGPSRTDTVQDPVHARLIALAEKAGYEVIIPPNIERLCCGMMFDSRGAQSAARAKTEETTQALLAASEMGKLPIVCDTSPCLAQLKAGINPELRFSLYEPVRFIELFLKDNLEFTQVKDSVSVHVPCTSKQQPGLEEAFVNLAKLCAKDVIPTGIPCCGMAGDRGLRYPELSAAACQHLDLPKEVTDGYSTAKTCEINVSNAAKMDFRSIVFLVDEATKPKVKRAGAAAKEELPQPAAVQHAPGTAHAAK